ncbi:hypothetical protein MACH09_46920 [Vibrio sp. MACH09]|uniref:type-F conjugative transfer system pilin assembly protein TrbC n=1 Tax=Vibrio sp. MACH09 TaxID=3025122 RepID=UPI00278CEE79|nr:type-F conjugative transfer system pilin assembly protein TrbC [Vibrio sp. MACH09]GLO64184.1 hypothetical protein MACH09_46920 [Vibrio sp. MACH09]
MKSSFLVLLALIASFCVHAYTEEELKALAERERAMMKSPPPPQDWVQVWDKARAHQQETTNLSQNVQGLIKPNALTELLNSPVPTENPDSAPQGVMAFVSLTMPRTSLKQLLKQSEKTGVPLVIRGVLPQGFPATTKRISQLVGIKEKQPINAGFSISPEWFRQFNVNRVPAFVSVKKGKCLPRQTCMPQDYDIVYGNVSIYQALNILEEGDTGDNARAIMKRLE